MTRSTLGYAEEAGELLQRYETIAFADRHGPVMHLLPAAPCTVLELRAGTGSDAAYLAARNGLRTILCAEAESTHEENRRAGIAWSHLVFERTAFV